MKYSAIVDGEQLEIELNPKSAGEIEAQIDGRKYLVDIMAVEPGLFWINWNHRSIEISIIPKGEGYLVSLNGRYVPIEIMDARTALRKASLQGHAGAIELRAPMPGKIVKVLMAEGDEAAANQGVLVMEAMKMQNEIKSPKKGIVKKVLVKEAAAVNAGDLLAVIGD